MPRSVYAGRCCRVGWVETEAGDVAIVQVPESYEVVFLKQKGGPEEVYVRRGTRTDALSGRILPTGPRRVSVGE